MNNYASVLCEFIKKIDKTKNSVYTIPNMAVLCVQKLNKRYGNGTVALREVSFETGDGGFLTVCGPCGAGKSVLLRIIAGLEDADSGGLLLDDQAVDEDISERNIVMTFENYVLKPNLTVRGNLEYGLKLRKTDPSVIDYTVRETADALGLSAILDKKPKEITPLQQKIAALGRALARKPRVFLMDEILLGLSDKEKALLITEIKRLKSILSGTPFLLTTAEPSEAVGLGEKTLLLYGGEVMGYGFPAELIADPQNFFTAAFFNELFVNIFPETEVLRVVRAEDMRIAECGGVRGIVCAIEQVLQIKTDGRNPPIYLTYAHTDNVRIGDEVGVTYNESKAFLFDRETGERIK